MAEFDQNLGSFVRWLFTLVFVSGLGCAAAGLVFLCAQSAWRSMSTTTKAAIFCIRRRKDIRRHRAEIEQFIREKQESTDDN